MIPMTTFTPFLFGEACAFLVTNKITMSQEIDEIERLRSKLEKSLTKLINKIGKIQIGRKEQFPFGWRKAAKGRTVWRIIEEIITQNLELHHKDFGISKASPSASEVSVYDMQCEYTGHSPLYINIKSAVEGGKRSKDDISKAQGLAEFYEENSSNIFMIATFLIKFNADMSIELIKAAVMPVAWIPDVYVNPSNNGNLQSSYAKDLDKAVKRTNAEFIVELSNAIAIANQKKKQKEK